MVNKATVISNLIEYPDWIPIVAVWHHEEWLRGQRAREGLHLDDRAIAQKKEERESLLATHIEAGSIPVTFIAHEAERPVGSVSLVHYQFTQNQQPTEWLTNLFVLPEHRGRGIGDRLLSHALRYAQHHKVARLMLYTSEHASFYRKRQWRSLNRGIVQGQKVDILDYLLE